MNNKIVISGCGLSGMLTALSFAKTGIEVTVVEARSVDDKRFFNDIRTTAFTASSREFLIKIDVWSLLEPVASQILDIYVVDNKAPEMLHFSSEIEVMGYIVPNPELKKILLTEVQKNNLITLIDNCGYKKVESNSDNCLLELENGMSIDCDLLIVCDGQTSKVRKHYFSGKIEKYYGQSAVVFNVTHEKKHEGTAIEHFMPGGPFAILPLKSQNHSSIVWTVGQDQALILKNLPIEELEYLVQKNFGEFLGKVTIDSEITAFPLKAYITENYFYQRITLIADTAHIIHPLSGQGLNQGIKDIDTLTSLIKEIGINTCTLEKYQELRQDDNMAMYLITDNLDRIFSNSSNILWKLRRLGLGFINNSPKLNSWLVKYAMGNR